MSLIAECEEYEEEEYKNHDKNTRTSLNSSIS